MTPKLKAREARRYDDLPFVTTEDGRHVQRWYIGKLSDALEEQARVIESHKQAYHKWAAAAWWGGFITGICLIVFVVLITYIASLYW